ncbi:MAG: cytochrome c peroxidase, partial [Bacteroidota bacterium]
DLKAKDEKALKDLGKRLFFDPRLSASNQISCASCHDPDLAWGDGRRRSFGHDRKRGKRNAPTLLNAGHWETLFWDGRATSLEEQVLGPLQDSDEMQQSLVELGPELSAIEGYPELFRSAFGVSDINVRKIAFSIAAFERGIHSRTSRFDHFLNGKYAVLTDQEIRGLHLFRTKGRCLNCHNGPLFSDQQFHNMGSHLLGRPDEDLGQYIVTDNWEDAGKFRTPSLRDIAYTGPYLHHGNIMELREVLQMYSAGMPQVIPKNVRKKTTHIPVHDPILERLDLSNEEIDDLLAFLQSISTRPRAMRIPELVK